MSDLFYKDTPGTVHIQKRAYAINLLWNQVPLGENPLKTAKESAKVINTRLICLENNLLGTQYGLADKRLGHKAGMHVLATHLDTSVGAFCGAWKFEQGVWYIFAINSDGVILSDKGVCTKDVAIEEFNNLLYSNEWDKIICPPDWLIPNSVDEPITLFFVKKKGRKIRTTSLNYNFLFLCLCSLFIIAGGVYFYINRYVSSENAEAVELLPETTVKPQTIKPQNIVTPWGDHIKPLSMLTQCITYIDANVLNAVSVPGWSWDDEASCDGNNVFFPIKKNGGTNLWLRSASLFISPPPNVIDGTGDTAVLSWSVSGTNKYKKQDIKIDDINNINDIKNFLSESFAQSFLSFDMNSSNNSNEHNLVKQSFNYSTKMNPGIYLPILVNVDGIVFDKITYSFKNNEWKVSGYFWGRMK